MDVAATHTTGIHYSMLNTNTSTYTLYQHGRLAIHNRVSQKVWMKFTVEYYISVIKGPRIAYNKAGSVKFLQHSVVIVFITLFQNITKPYGYNNIEVQLKEQIVEWFIALKSVVRVQLRFIELFSIVIPCPETVSYDDACSFFVRVAECKLPRA